MAARAVQKVAKFGYVRKHTDVLSVKIAQDRKLKQSKGYALVKVPAEADVDQLLSTRHNINGRRVDIQLAAKRSEKQQCQDEVKKRKLFVRDIDKAVTNEMLEREFSKNPLIKSGYIDQKMDHLNRSIGYVIRDYYTGESKGYGYLQLVSAEAARFLMKKGLLISGAPVTLLPYKYKYEPKSELDSTELILRSVSDESQPVDRTSSYRTQSLGLKNHFVRTDSPREEGDEAITMKVDGHGSSATPISYQLISYDHKSWKFILELSDWQRLSTNSSNSGP